MIRWPVPPGTTGDISLIRTNLPASRLDPRDCPLKRSSDARPMLRADPEAVQRAEALQDFTLKVFMDAMDLIEHGRMAPEWAIEQLWLTEGTFGLNGRRRAHPVLLAWTVEAVQSYVAARKADQQMRQAAGLPATHPVPDKWVVGQDPGQIDSRGADTYEATAWGRRYAAQDGSTRDLWLLSFGATKEDRPEAEKAAAAFVAARGMPAKGGWKARHTPVPAGALHPGRTTAPERVRVIEFGCGEGTSAELLDWDRAKVQQRFASDAWPALARAVDDTRVLPGSSCVDCKALSGCGELVRSPGLLQMTPAGPKRARRSVSVTDLRSYRDCPAKYHATRQLKLRTAQPESPEIRRGRAVDSWLNERHGTHPHGGCRTLPGPADPSSWTSAGLHLVGKEAEDGASMLEQHAQVCPLNGLAPGELVRVQHQVTCYDPELDLVLIATPDLLYTRRGGWVWWEMKTANSRLYEGEPLMASYPQLAMGVLLLAAGVLGGDIARSRVEFELLHSDDLTFLELDPSRSQVVSEAREVIAALARPWADDQLYPATPGRPCGSCEARNWCRPGSDHLAATVATEEA
ncbi:PD-(D/E)XK nuclease family protein [Kitasatospora aureofaciens]|uniref:PD-(D/E)XK nuclease family protein n=1 Tax=Kitasatospora aureofaciens TaxID=1894 RepID=UPI0038054903